VAMPSRLSRMIWVYWVMMCLSLAFLPDATLPPKENPRKSEGFLMVLFVAV
jgi:hypothetical protein